MRLKESLVFRVLMKLVLTVVLIYAALIGYVCLKESSVPTKLEEVGNYDCIVVLGCQVLPDGTPNVQLSLRLDLALEAYQAKPVPMVLCGGQGEDEPVTEAVAMKNYLVEHGVPEEALRLDETSVNTRENIAHAIELLDDMKEGYNMLVISSDYHVPRAVSLAKDELIQVKGLGAKCKAEYWLKNHAREALSWVKYWAQKYLNWSL